jgi:hypothetical protein
MKQVYLVVDENGNILSKHYFRWLAEKTNDGNTVMYIDDYAAKYGTWFIISTHGININIFSRHLEQADADNALDTIQDKYSTYEVMSSEVWISKQRRVILTLN